MTAARRVLIAAQLTLAALILGPTVLIIVIGDVLAAGALLEGLHT